MHFTYRTKGTCSQEILFDVDGKTVKTSSYWRLQRQPAGYFQAC